jgi:hypothetical protein
MFLRIYAHEGQRLSTSFEAFAEAVAHWPGMFLEGDGSFVWSIPHRGGRFQIDGMVYDRDGAIEYVEIKGDAIPALLQQLLQSLACDRSNPSTWDRQIRIHDIEQQIWLRPSELLIDRDRGTISDAY